MAPRIVLVRHGRSAHIHREGWITAAGMHRWRASYDAAGLAAGEMPPPALMALAGSAQLLVASDLPRASASAALLAPGRDVRISPLLRETPLAISNGLPFRLPLRGWATLILLQWGYRIVRGTDAEPEERARAADAAAMLIELAGDDATVVAVTHGVFRRLLAIRLRALRWQAEPGRRDYDHWSAWGFHPPREPRSPT
jgi:broad specificity phosphatase PhoE